MYTKPKFNDRNPEKIDIIKIFKSENCPQHPVREIEKICLHPNCLKTLNNAFLCKKCYEEHLIKHQIEGTQTEYIKYRLAMPGKLVRKVDDYLSSDDMNIFDDVMKNIDTVYNNYQEHVNKQLNESKKKVMEFVQQNCLMLNSKSLFEKLKQNITNNAEQFVFSKADLSLKLSKYFETIKINYKELKSVSVKMDIAREQVLKIQSMLKDIEGLTVESSVKIDKCIEKFIENFDIPLLPKNDKTKVNFLEENLDVNVFRKESFGNLNEISSTATFSSTKDLDIDNTLSTYRFQDNMTIPQSQSPPIYPNSPEFSINNSFGPLSSLQSSSKLAKKAVNSSQLQLKNQLLTQNSSIFYKTFDEMNNTNPRFGTLIPNEPNTPPARINSIAMNNIANKLNMTISVPSEIRNVEEGMRSNYGSLNDQSFLNNISVNEQSFNQGRTEKLRTRNKKKSSFIN